MGRFFTGKLRIISVLCGGALLWIGFAGETARSFSAGAPAGYCNAPSNGGSTCYTCHNTGPAPVTVPGMITSNAPVAGYTPGATYTITATVTGVGHNRFGFEISPQDLSGNLVGSMNDLGTETMFQAAGLYITHSNNSLLNNDWKSWQFEWTAPVSGTGNVTFYGAFNVTNNDGAYTGDTVQLSTLTIIENTGVSINDYAGSAFNPQITAASGFIRITGIKTEINQLQLFDLNGKQIMKTESPIENTGSESVQIELPLGIASGIYIVNITSGDNSCSSKILLNN